MSGFNCRFLLSSAAQSTTGVARQLAAQLASQLPRFFSPLIFSFGFPLQYPRNGGCGSPARLTAGCTAHAADLGICWKTSRPFFLFLSFLLMTTILCGQLTSVCRVANTAQRGESGPLAKGRHRRILRTHLQSQGAAIGRDCIQKLTVLSTTRSRSAKNFSTKAAVPARRRATKLGLAALPRGPLQRGLAR